MYIGRLYYLGILFQDYKRDITNIPYKKAALGLTGLNQYIKLYRLSRKILQQYPSKISFCLNYHTAYQ